MLRKIWVTNFRSLEDFSLKIEPKLNVLVGPNGAGKTSIMKWFEFLSLLSSYSLREAVGKIGGASHVFRRKNEKFSDSLCFSFSGNSSVRESYGLKNKNKENISHFTYEYYGEISFIRNQIFFSVQKTKIWIKNNTKPTAKIENLKPDILVDWNYDIITDKVSCDVNYIPRKKYVSEMEKYFFENTKFLEKYLREKMSIEHLICGFQILPFDYLNAIRQDLKYKKAYNINPNSVRTTLDIASQPGVQHDGSGVVSTLYEIKNRGITENRFRYNIYTGNDQSGISQFQKAIDYFKLSDSSIDKIEVEIDNIRNEFQLDVCYDSEFSSFKVPIFLLSDGTVKWLAIVTALATELHSLFIEEPENFLHPRLQESIVDILRAEINLGDDERFAFITTHSETLLNKLTPHEIVITSMHDGKTVSERVEDPDEISAIIADSGFGLGYLYASGGF